MKKEKPDDDDDDGALRNTNSRHPGTSCPVRTSFRPPPTCPSSGGDRPPPSSFRSPIGAARPWCGARCLFRKYKYLASGSEVEDWRLGEDLFGGTEKQNKMNHCMEFSFSIHSSSKPGRKDLGGRFFANTRFGPRISKKTRTRPGWTRNLRRRNLQHSLLAPMIRKEGKHSCERFQGAGPQFYSWGASPYFLWAKKNERLNDSWQIGTRLRRNVGRNGHNFCKNGVTRFFS